MKLHRFLLSRKVKICAIFFSVLLVADLVLYLFVLDRDPILTILSEIDNTFLLSAEKIAAHLMSWTGSRISIKDHVGILNNEVIQGFVSMTIYKKWAIPLFLLILITNTTYREKILFSLMLILLFIILNSIDIAVKAHYTSLGLQNGPQIALSVTGGTMTMATFLVFWYRKHKSSILGSLNKIPVDAEILENKLIPVIVIMYSGIFLVNFVMNYFDFRIWINILFGFSQKILSILGYEAGVEPFLLTGEYGNISMAKSCLGYNTMFLFASVVYLTGKNKKSIWIFIVFGLLILNLANVSRFVLLFIHLQKHGDYNLAVDMHNLYNYSIYLIVFVLWMIWFTRFSDDVPLKTGGSRSA